MAFPSNGAHYRVIHCGCECGVHTANPHKQPSLRVLSQTETLHSTESRRTNIALKSTRRKRESWLKKERPVQMVPPAMTRTNLAKKEKRKDSLLSKSISGK